MSQGNSDNGRAEGLRFLTGTLGSTRRAVVGTIQLSANDPFMHFIDTLGATVTVKLPPLGAGKGSLVRIISNVNAGGQVNIQTSAGVAITFVPPNSAIVCVASDNEWVAVGAATGTELTGFVSPDSSLTVSIVGTNFSGVVSPSHVDHDLLLHYVADKHVAHTGVSVNLPSAVFSGYGDISATRTISFVTQVQKTFFAGPTGGADATPAFRTLAAADVPALAYVTSIALAVPASTLTVAGSPITSNGTITVGLATQVANTVFAGPTSGGVTTPTWRALVAADLPSTSVQSVVNDTNVTGSISAQALTLGWTGTLALSRLAQGTDGQLIVGQTSAASLYKTLSGDATLSAAGALTLASTISAAGPIGSATAAPTITYDAKGRLTTVTTTTITPAVGSITGFGTGVATALGVNVGTAGAFVTNGGALGTPSSGVATNLTGTAASLTAGAATILATARSIYGNNFDGSAALAQIIASTYGGTGNGFTKFTGPTTSEKTFTLPNASATVLTDNAAVTVSQGGSGRASTTAYAVICGGTTSTAAEQSIASVGTSGQVLTSNGAGALPTFQTLAGTGTVTSVATGTGLTGGTITASGTISMANMAARTIKGVSGTSTAAPGDASVRAMVGWTMAILTASNASWSVPAGTTDMIIEMWGAGGGGGGGNTTTTQRGSGAGSGGYNYKEYSGTMDSTLNVTVGAGGAGGAAGATGSTHDGAAGGNTSVVGTNLGTVGANGGAAGVAGTAASVSGGTGGSTSGGDFPIGGQDGQVGPSGLGSGVSQGGSAPRGGPGGTSNVGQVGTVPGGGGACGNHTGGANGGNGADGRVIIWTR